METPTNEEMRRLSLQVGVCPRCKTNMSDILDHKGRKYRHCYSCHSDFYLEEPPESNGKSAPVYLYGMRARGFSPGCQPTEGWLDTETDPLDEYHNVLVYSRQLDEKELREYELDYIGKRQRVPGGKGARYG